MIVPTGDNKPPMNDALLQYNNCKLSLKEKNLLITWHESLMTQGVTGMMVNSLEMIIKFSNEIMKVHGMEIPPRMTWMDGLEKGNPCNPSHVTHYGLKILFVLMCSPCATDKKLKSLDGYLNSSEFSLDIVSSMLVADILSKIQQMGMQTRMHCTSSKLFKKLNMYMLATFPKMLTC